MLVFCPCILYVYCEFKPRPVVFVFRLVFKLILTFVFIDIAPVFVFVLDYIVCIVLSSTVLCCMIFVYIKVHYIYSALCQFHTYSHTSKTLSHYFSFMLYCVRQHQIMFLYYMISCRIT